MTCAAFRPIPNGGPAASISIPAGLVVRDTGGRVIATVTLTEALDRGVCRGDLVVLAEEIRLQLPLDLDALGHLRNLTWTESGSHPRVRR